MERRALVLALALTLPLALYGIPYAYAVTTQSTYVKQDQGVVPASSSLAFHLQCSSSSDFTQHWSSEHERSNLVEIRAVDALNNNGLTALNGDNPNGWLIVIHNPSSSNAIFESVQIICQSPITTVAGVGVPEFGSLYVAIALGALVYFMLARRSAKRSIISR